LAIGACLAEAHMSFGNIVRINTYVTDRSRMAAPFSWAWARLRKTWQVL
jgi:enamine deaminase RidA (YjgF/YER057c/UK114 family)